MGRMGISTTSSIVPNWAMNWARKCMNLPNLFLGMFSFLRFFKLSHDPWGALEPSSFAPLKRWNLVVSYHPKMGIRHLLPRTVWEGTKIRSTQKIEKPAVFFRNFCWFFPVLGVPVVWWKNTATSSLLYQRFQAQGPHLVKRPHSFVRFLPGGQKMKCHRISNFLWQQKILKRTTTCTWHCKAFWSNHE